MRRLLTWKKSGAGNVLNAALSTIISVLAVYMMIVALVQCYKTLDSMNDVNRVIRTYLSRMETGGGLSVTEVEMLIADLESQGIHNIKLTGNFETEVVGTDILNLGPADYGEYVVLELEGTLTIKNVKEMNTGFLAFQIGSNTITVKIQKKGLSLK